MGLESAVLNYLKMFGWDYTKTMYVNLKVKLTYNLSLNKFRLFLRNLQKQGKIIQEYRDTDCNITYWTLKKE